MQAVPMQRPLPLRCPLARTALSAARDEAVLATPIRPDLNGKREPSDRRRAARGRVRPESTPSSVERAARQRRATHCCPARGALPTQPPRRAAGLNGQRSSRVTRYTNNKDQRHARAPPPAPRWSPRRTAPRATGRVAVEIDHNKPTKNSTSLPCYMRSRRLTRTIVTRFP